MRTSRLFTSQSLSINERIFLDDKKSHYVTHVLRLKPQHLITLFNGLEECDYSANIEKTGKKVELTIKEKVSTHVESPLNTTIFQALSKNDHIDLMIQKCTELGVNSIVIFNSERTQIPLKNNKLDKKLAHWQQIAYSACEQCGRSITPAITFYTQLDTALKSVTSAKKRLILDFNGEPIQKLLKPQKENQIDLLIGAEGGLSDSEINLAKQHDFSGIRLGPRVLRTETASISALSIIQMLSGDLN